MNEDKLILLLRMTEHTDTVSDQQLSALLNDREIRAYYETMVWLKQAFQTKTETPSLIRQEQNRRPSWARYAATVVITLLAVASLVVAAVCLSNGKSKDFSPAVETSESVVEKAQVFDGNTAPAIMAKKTYENETLRAILSDLAQYYGMEVSYATQDTPSLRLHFIWNPTDDIDTVIDLFNHFDHIEINRQGKTLFVK